MSLFEEITKPVNSTSMFYAQRVDNLILCSYHYINLEVYRRHLLAREIRGITFDEKEKVVPRLFPKFFNWNEPLCTAPHDTPAVANEKLDGSLVSTSYYDGQIVVASKGSLKSWVVEKAKPYVTSHENYKQLVEDFEGHTVMFELLDPEYPIVVIPKKFELVLIGIRHNETGKIVSPSEFYP